MTHQNHPVDGKSSQSTDTGKTFKVLSHEENRQTDECSGHHHHVNMKETTGTRLLITLVLNLIIPVIQVVAGVFAHSMALISDATHNFSDFMAIFISYIAYRIGRKGATAENTFGYRRAEVMAALLNVIILAGACIFILYGAFQRFLAPEIVAGKIVIWAALVGIVGNGFSAWLLHLDSKHNLNVKGAFLHMLGDFLTSVVVLISGFVMMYKPWYWLDPLLSILIAIFILKNCWTILKSSTNILMNATPGSLNLNDIRSHLLEVEDIKSVHYLHAWPVSSSGISFSCHLVVPDQMVSQTEMLSQRIRHSIFHKFGIDHPVLQFETESCGNGTLLCEKFAGAKKETVI
ncbi:MAG: cation transporter [Deltaproteobacteria bacterium]|nr:MAG: cation transporter [Deltaproteobacteria bacterium]